MVEVVDLLGLARLLAEADGEAARRASISRSYYAAFHQLREMAEDSVGLPSFGTAADHRDLERAIRALDEPVADTLALLRRERNRADYELKTTVSRPQALFLMDPAAHLVAWSQP